MQATQIKRIFLNQRKSALQIRAIRVLIANKTTLNHKNYKIYEKDI